MYKTLAAAAAIALAPLAATAATSISGSGGTFDLDATESAYSYQGTTSFDANQTWSFVVQDVTRSVTGTLISFGAIATPTSVPSITFAGQSLGDGDSFTLNPVAVGQSYDVVLDLAGGSKFVSLQFTIDSDPAPIPVPAALPLVATGVGALALMRRKRKAG